MSSIAEIAREWMERVWNKKAYWTSKGLLDIHRCEIS
jgi:hypothetical protein